MGGYHSALGLVWRGWLCIGHGSSFAHDGVAQLSAWRTRDGASCLHLDALGPAPLTPNVRIMRIAPDQLSPHVSDATHISRGRRVGLWFIAWGFAAVATVAPAFGLLFFCWLFPMGLVAPFGASDWTSPAATNGTLIIGWGLYLALSVYSLRQRQRARYMVAYTVLIALLILNVAGCRYQVAHFHIGC